MKNGDNPQDWPSRLREAMSRAGLTQAEVAELTGFTQPAVSYWLSGARTPHPSTQKWVLLRIKKGAHRSGRKESMSDG